MTSYKVGRFLAGATRVFGVLMIVGGVGAAASSAPPGLQASFYGAGMLLFGIVSSAVFDIADASRQGVSPQEPNDSLGPTDPSPRD